MPDWLAHRARASPGKTALIFGEQQWRYGDLEQEVALLCGQLAGAGIQPGQHVAALMTNRPEFVFLIHALARLGAVLVPLNIRLTAAELRWQVAQAECSAVICCAETETQAVPLAEVGLRLLSMDPANSPEVESLAEIAPVDFAAPPLALEAIQGLIFTSGTTGRPKGALLTFGNHFWSASASAYRLGTVPTDRWLLCMPLYHVGGLAIVLRCCLYGTAVVLQQGFDQGAVHHALEHQAVSLISVVPTMLHRLLETGLDRAQLPHLRCILVGGAALSPHLAERCAALALPVAATYGLTEAASQVATAGPSEALQKPGSVGKPLLFSSVRIVDTAGNPLPPGDIGEIVVSGPTVMAGYYRQPEATAKALRLGELYTGDMGYLDGEGDLWVVQRRADLIVSGGENVYPVEIETVLQAHSAVAQACVVGLPDEVWGQRVAAAVVLKEGVGVERSDLLDHCRAQLAGYKQPRQLHFVSSLPLTASGKVRRETVREWLQDMLLDY